MTGKNDETNKLRCSFCGKTQDQVKKLIAGPNVYICDECIDLCADIIDEEYETLAKEDEVKELPKPKQIKEILDQYVIGQDRAKQADTFHLFCFFSVLCLHSLCVRFISLFLY